MLNVNLFIDYSNDTFTQYYDDSLLHLEIDKSHVIVL